MNDLRQNTLDKAVSKIAIGGLVAATLLFFCNFCTAQTTSTTESAASAPSVRAQLIGSWRLISRQSRRASGDIEPDRGLSEVPLGVLIYDNSGHVAAQLSRRDRSVATLPEECKAAAGTKGTPDTAQTILGYDAYFGTYSIDEHDGTVTHHLEAALFPGDVGKDIQRRFKISGDQLTIAFDTTTSDGVKVTRTLIWQRMK